MAVKNSMANRQGRLGLTAYLTQDAVKDQINRVVGGKNGPRFISSIVSAVQATPALQECSNSSILSAALLGESLNLSPSPQLGQFYMVPYDNRNKGMKEAQFQLGYKGYIQLATRSGQYKKLTVLAIKEGELVRFDPLDEVIEVNLIEDEELRENAPAMGYYAMFEYTNGFRKALYWSRAKMEAHAKKYSPGYKKDLEKGTQWTFWAKDFDGMAYKTMLRQLISKWGIMSIDMIQAMDADMAVIHEDGTKDYVEAETVVSDQEADVRAEGEGQEKSEMERQAAKAPEPVSETESGDETPDKVLESFFS